VYSAYTIRMSKSKKIQGKRRKQQIERIVKNLPDTLTEKEKIAFAKNQLGQKVKNIFTTPKKPVKKQHKSVNPSFKFYKPKDGEGTIPLSRSYKPVSGGKVGGKK